MKNYYLAIYNSRITYIMGSYIECLSYKNIKR